MMKRLIFLLLSTFSIGLYGQTFITNDGISITNSATIVVNGDWNNAGTFLHTGVIKTDGTFQNTGSMSSASTGGFELNYTGTKALTLGGKNLGYLVIKGGGTVELPNDLKLSDSLVLTQGFIKLLNANDTLTLGPGAFIKTPSPTSYVKGTMMREGTGDRLFPIGDDLYYLPIKFLAVQGTAPKVTVSLEATPPYTAGAAVTSLIGFPYTWRSHVANPGDTASFIEIQYPNVLPIDPDLVVVRNASGQTKFDGMGRRNLVQAGGTVKVTSYSKGIRGLFSVAAGFPGNITVDSLALVAVYNATNGPGWTTKTNWLTGQVSTWHGVTQTGGSVTALNLPGNNISGIIPAGITDINGLQTVNVSNNQITAIPAISTIEALTTLNVSGNKLNFGSLEANASIPTINYQNQAVLGTPASLQINVGTNHTVTTNGGGTADVYQWKRNGTAISGATNSNYQITAINRSNIGDYEAEISNPSVPGLVLRSAPQNLLAIATLSGKMVTSTAAPITNGKITLLRVTDQDGYDTTAVRTINTDGTYSFSNILLDDYALVGYADTLVHQGALPTYYVNTIFWEEADTLFLNSNLTNLDIVSAFKPGPPTTGSGVVSGTVTSPGGGSGGRAMAGGIANAGVSLRKVNGSTVTLIAHAFTNANGEFYFNKMDVGDYKLNIQYPGYPMDPNSFVNLTIGTGPLDKQVSVDAQVVDGKIVVTERIITGIRESEILYSVHPNPSSDWIRIKSKSGNSQHMLLHVMENTGRKISVPSQYVHHEDVWMMDVRSLPVGLYLINIEDQGTRNVEKVVIRR